MPETDQERIDRYWHWVHDIASDRVILMLAAPIGWIPVMSIDNVEMFHLFCQLTARAHDMIVPPVVREAMKVAQHVEKDY